MMWNMVFITTNWKECNNHAIWIQKYNDVVPHNLHILLSCLKCWWNISFLLFLQFPAFPHTTCDITFYIIFRCFQIMFLPKLWIRFPTKHFSGNEVSLFVQHVCSFDWIVLNIFCINSSFPYPKVINSEKYSLTIN